MSESYVQVPPDSSGKLLRARSVTFGTLTEYMETLVIADPTTTGNLQSVNASGQASIQQGWNSGRTAVVLVIDRATGVTTEALVSATINRWGATVGIVTTASTFYQVTAGKVLRLQSFDADINDTGTVVASGRVRVRLATSSLAASSPIIINSDIGAIGSTVAANEGSNAPPITIPDGLEIPAGWQIGISQVLGSTSTTVSAALIGFEY
jgi:hypothetical protein